ncbi:hypothetical protein AAFP35_24670 [Gordonia sp. CPCC 206044]|uniref:hypothetical protein n=1 Tax=Gordonia sp. CPCC 206044 TaxID=3140793 RepID=UPI003AF39158
MRRTIGTIGALAVAGAVTTGVGAAHAAPVPVYQIPASAVAVSGLVVPGPYFANVTAATTGIRGETAFSAPASPSICSSSAAGALVRIGYLNTATGRSGVTTVKPCPYYLNPTPVVSKVRTGSGQIIVTVQVTGSAAYPNAGQPSLPGIGTFTAP